jgi:hypothetical protein
VDVLASTDLSQAEEDREIQALGKLYCDAETARPFTHRRHGEVSREDGSGSMSKDTDKKEPAGKEGMEKGREPTDPLPLALYPPARERSDMGWSTAVRLTLLVFGASISLTEAAPPQLTRVRPPDGGIQPQAVSDARGVLHLIYFKGDPAAGDLFYVRQPPGGHRREAVVLDFSKPIRVNSQPGSAIAVGTIRGGQLALGKDGRVHVAWNGSGRALPKGPGGGSPMLYARLNDTGTAFEPQRNLMRSTRLLDGGGSVAADRAGNVYVTWHAADGSSQSEADRRLWVARSKDDGTTFSREALAFAQPTGACACCATRAFVDSRGTVYNLYRAAMANVDRDMFLLTSRNGGESFQGANIHRWKVNSCPMSSMSFAESAAGVAAAWETEGQVCFASIDPNTLKMRAPIAAPGAGTNRKHPALAINARGETLLVWTEGTGWQKGGDLAWQLFDAEGRPTAERGRVAGAIPVWGLAAVVARPDGGFTLIH